MKDNQWKSKHIYIQGFADAVGIDAVGLTNGLKKRN